MAKFYRRGLQSPINSDCLNQKTLPHELHVGSDCEREVTGNDPLVDNGDISDGYDDGYRDYKFIAEDPRNPIAAPEANPKSLDNSGYHRVTVGEIFSGMTKDGKCASPYSRGVMDAGGINGVIAAREEQLLNATGKPVALLRRQFTGPVCPCKSVNRGRSRTKCMICFGTSFVPGYVPYINQADVLGRIKVRFSPYTEDNPQKELGIFQEVSLSGWTLSHPLLRKRDVLIVYNPDGTEEFRYEVQNVERNQLFGDTQGAQKFTVKRIDPTQTIYKLDPFAIPDLLDTQVDISDTNPVIENRMYEQLGTDDDGLFPNATIEGVYGDGAFSGMFTEGYKKGYELNYRRVLNFETPLLFPDFNEDGSIQDDGYGPIFRDSNNKIIRFSTPQQVETNPGINPLEVLAAEEKRHFLQGFSSGAKHGVLDGENELRARGFLTGPGIY